MNFSIRYTSPSDNAWGTLNPDGTWTGIVRQLHDGRANIWYVLNLGNQNFDNDNSS